MKKESIYRRIKRNCSRNKKIFIIDVSRNNMSIYREIPERESKYSFKHSFQHVNVRFHIVSKISHLRINSICKEAFS